MKNTTKWYHSDDGNYSARLNQPYRRSEPLSTEDFEEGVSVRVRHEETGTIVCYDVFADVGKLDTPEYNCWFVDNKHRFLDREAREAITRVLSLNTMELIGWDRVSFR